MRLSLYLQPELVVADLSASTNIEVVEGLVERVLQVLPQLDRAALLGALLDREQQVSTGLESGVAVPHATLEGLAKTTLAVARLARPVDFGTLDGSPVRIVFMMLSPPDAIATHIRLLARLARLCSSDAFLTAILEAPDAQALLEVILQEDARHV